jgi:hypothetical protein
MVNGNFAIAIPHDFDCIVHLSLLYNNGRFICLTLMEDEEEELFGFEEVEDYFPEQCAEAPTKGREAIAGHRFND